MSQFYISFPNINVLIMKLTSLKQLFFLLGCIMLIGSNTTSAQTGNTQPEEVGLIQPGQKRQREKKSYDRFNYTYLRLAYYFPSSGFNNPIAAGFPGSENFIVTEDLSHSFRLGLESGKVRHFMNLNLGTEMLKLGINSGIGLQAFGPDEKETVNAIVHSDGFYQLRLGLGPQITFKPIEDLRIGVYYRAGIALYYSGYRNEQEVLLAGNSSRYDYVETRFLNIGYNGDIGLDFSWRSLSVGISYSMMKGRPSKAALIKSESLDEEYNTYTSTTYVNGSTEGTDVVVPIDPTVKWRRFGISVGFAF